MTSTPNDARRQGWNGPGGEYWAAHADHFDRAARAYQQPLLDAVDARPGERVLDVGCGNGALTRELALRTGSAVGIDLSGPMLAIARSRSDGVSGAEFVPPVTPARQRPPPESISTLPTR